MKLNMGKFYRTVNGHYLWKTDKIGPELSQGNKQMTILLPDTLVMVTKHGKFRYVQVVYEDMVGYVWCATNVPTGEHFREVDLENDDEHKEPNKQLRNAWRKVRS
jgi:hypothetical protein